MGKRIGMARFEALLEGLKREIDFSGSKILIDGASGNLNRMAGRATDRYYLEEFFKQRPMVNDLLYGSETLNPGSIADGDEQAEEVAVVGAVLGDFAMASFSIDVLDLVVTAEVTAADVVTVVILNNTGGSLDIGSGTLAVQVVKAGNLGGNAHASRDFELEGTNAVSSCAAFSATLPGVALTTTTADQDQCIVRPHEDTNQSAWNNVKWPTQGSTEWECSLTLAQIDNLKLWAGLKLTTDQLGATDADQIYFKAATDLTNGEALATSDNAAMAVAGGNMLWHCIYTIAGVDYTTNLGLAVAAGTTYHLKIVINSDRQAAVYINGTQYGLVNDSGHTGGHTGTTATWGATGTLANGAVDASATTGNQTLTVDGVSAFTTYKAGDTIFKSDRTLFGIIKTVDSATQITLVTCLADIADDDILYNFGQKVVSGKVERSKALTDEIDLVPVVGIENGDGAAAVLRLHYMAMNRTIAD